MRKAYWWAGALLVTTAACAALILTAQAAMLHQPAERVGSINDPRVKEASGIAASPQHPGIFWTHNDGDDGVLLAIRRDGSVVGSTRVEARFDDWEDIGADGDGHLFLADTGNNDRERKHVSVLRILEPNPENLPATIEPADRWRLDFPKKPFDCEALFVRGEYGYLISKVDKAKPTIFRFLLAERKQTLQSLDQLPVEEPVTAADLSPDGKLLVVLTRDGVYSIDMEEDMKIKVGSQPRRIALPPLQWEGICFGEGELLIIAETGEISSIPLTRTTTQP
jgi:hypothetical protein